MAGYLSLRTLGGGHGGLVFTKIFIVLTFPCSIIYLAIVTIAFPSYIEDVKPIETLLNLWWVVLSPICNVIIFLVFTKSIGFFISKINVFLNDHNP